MTCAEKYKELYGNDPKKPSVEKALTDYCPSYFGIMDDPYEENEDGNCFGIDKGEEVCMKCWNREVSDKPNEVGNVQDFEKILDIHGNAISGVPHILDSGTRREFETGAVRDIQEGKGRMDLLPWAAIMEVSKHCENGAKKYGEHNVDKGIPTHSLCDSAARHLAKYLDGWTDEPHLLAAAWNLLWAIQIKLKHPELCDTPWKGD